MHRTYYPAFIFGTIFYIANSLFFIHTVIAANHDTRPQSSQRPASLDRPAHTFNDLGKKINDAKEYADTLKKEIPATGLTGLNTNLNNAIKNGVDPAIGGLSVAEGVVSAYRIAISVKPDAAKGITAGEVFSEIISQKEEAFRNESERNKKLELRADTARKGGSLIMQRAALDALEKHHELLRMLDAERQTLQTLYYLVTARGDDVKPGEVIKKLISDADKAISGFNKASEIVDGAIGRAKAVLPKDVHSPTLRLDSAQIQAMAADPDPAVKNKESMSNKMRLAIRENEKRWGSKNFMPVDDVDPYNRGYFPSDGTVEDSALRGRSAPAPVNPESLYPELDVQQLKKSGQRAFMTREELVKAMADHIKAVEELDLKNNAVASRGRALKVLKGFGRTFLGMVPFLPMPSDVGEAFSGKTEDDYITEYQSEIRRAQEEISSINAKIVLLETKMRDTPIAISKPEGVSMKAAGSQDRESLKKDIVNLYNKRSEWELLIWKRKYLIQEKIDELYQKSIFGPNVLRHPLET